MYPNKGAQCYSQLANNTGTEDASSHQLISLLFQNAQNSLQQAIGCIERKQFEGRSKQLGRVINIISGLQGFLDHEKGGEIAGNLDKLYEYMLLRINDANINNSVTEVKEVSQLLTEIQSGWEAIANTAIEQSRSQVVE